MSKILFLDDDPQRHAFMNGDNVVHCHTLGEFEAALKTDDKFDIISLDHDLNDFEGTKSVLWDGQEGTGMDACGILVGRFRDKIPEEGIRIHSLNPCGAKNMVNFLRDRDIRVIWIPFSAE